ncbi:hypothetical protein BC332_05248 [Capsicum chinense]|nr:hypothetical protein BC332_05248 [Capsicum chinense]
MEQQQTKSSKNFSITWSDLPKELAERIGECLDTHIDVLRFRSVCAPWRSSIPPFKTTPFEIPFPLDLPDPSKGKPGYHLVESVVYMLQPVDVASIDSPCKGWLVKFIETADGKVRVLNPLTGRLIRDLPDHMPKVLNLLDFRVSQVCKSYHVQYYNPSRTLLGDYDVGYVRKILLLNNRNAGSEGNRFSLMAIDRYGLLRYLKSGDEKWTRLKNASSYIDDIVVYEGNFYAVDRYGETVKYDSSFNEMMVASRLSGGDRRKTRLVESGGQLFLVDSSSDYCKSTELEMKMYRLDEGKNEWIEVNTLGDRIFFAVNDCCFSVSSRDFGDQYCRGNCIYYVNGAVYYDDEDSDDDMSCGCCCGFSDNESVAVYFEGYEEFNYTSSKISNDSGSKSGGVREEKVVNIYEGVLDNNTGVCTIKDGKLGSLLSSLDYAEILWPPPSWLNGVDQIPSPAHEIAGTNKDEVAS